MKSNFMINRFVKIAIVFVALFLIPTFVQAMTPPGDYQIVVNGGAGETDSSLVEIVVTHSYSGGTDGWYCIPHYSNGGGAWIEFNNTGNAAYYNIGDGQCINGWSFFQWDLAGYDGNDIEGLRTIHFQMSESGGNGSSWATRQIVYKKPIPQPITPTPTPAPTVTTEDNQVSDNQASNDAQQVSDQTPIKSEPTKPVDKKTALVQDKPKAQGVVAGLQSTKKPYWIYIIYGFMVLLILGAIFWLGLKLGKNKRSRVSK